MRLKLATLAILAAGATIASAAHNWHLESHYTFNVDPAWGQPVTNIICMMEGGSVDNSYGWGSKAWAFTSASSPTLAFDTDWFDLEAAQPTLIGSLHVGIVQDLPNDAPGQKHAVLFMDADAASRTSNIAWGTFFNHTNEDSLIYAIEQATSGGSWEYINPFLQEIDTFAQGDAKHGNLGPFGTEGSAWFTPGHDFSIVAWSDGKVIGTGSNTYDVQYQSVPEPTSLAVLAAGPLFLLHRRRNRR